MKLKQPDIKGFTHSSGSMEKSKPTPMIKQYLEVKNRHKDYLLFYRMGDFYELFFNDAKVASSQLGIALTKRGKLNDEDIPMCGVPAHSSQTYLSRLINLGHKVAIAEQLEDEDQNDVKKNQKIFKRDVVRIITPGTILDDSLLESKSYNHLLSISSFKGDIAISWTDMTTGTIKLQRIKGKNLIDDLFECTNRIEPGEIIVSDSFEKLKILDSRFNQFESKITRIPSSFFDEENNKKKIKEFFNNSQIESFGDLKTIDISALGAVLNYLELTQKKNIPLIKNIEIVQKQDFMQIDNFSVKSLELFEKIDGEKKGSLLSIIDKTKTASGGRLLKDFLKSPLIKTKDIKARHNLIEAFLKDSISMKKIIDLLSGQPDVERALSRISAKTNNPRDLLIVSNFLENSEKIFLGIRECNESIIKNLLPDKNFQENAKTLKFLINKNIKAPPPINLNDGDVIKEGVNVKLDYLRNIKNDKQNEILQMQARYSKLTSVLNLKIKFNNIHGYFIEVTNKNSNKIINFPGLKFNLIQNTINNARFQTEELRDASNEIQNAQMNSIDLEKKNLR
jgi:DNA mismatch repair protein MutS